MGLTEIIYSISIIFGVLFVLLFVISFFASRSSSKKRTFQFEQPYEIPTIKVVTQEIPVQQEVYNIRHQRMRRVS